MTNYRNRRITLAVAAVAITSIIVLSSWDSNRNITAGRNGNGFTVNDTVPKKDKKIRDLDDVIDELNAAEFKLDMEKIQQQIKESMKQFDAQKIQLDFEKAMRDVDFQKIQKEIEQSMSKIDFEKIQKEMAQAMKEFDGAKLQKELQESMQKIEWDKMKNEFDKIKDIDMKKFQLDMEKAKLELDNLGPQLEKAKESIEKAKEEMKEYKGFVDGLEKDGLINKKDEYTIKHKDGELFINGKKASDATYNKYRSFLHKHKTFKIEKSDDDFNIDID